MRELLLLIIVIVLMLFIIMAPDDIATFPNARITFGFGFLLVSAYIIGLFFSKIKLPKISGYMIAGILFGPHFLNFFPGDVLNKMNVINQLALTFIALNAGGELKLSEIAENKKRIIWLILLLTAFIFTGMTLFVLTFNKFIPFVESLSFTGLIVVGCLVGTISVARSPSSIIAIMQEYKAHGPFSEVVLGVTVAMDFLVIMIFAVVVSISEVLLVPGQEFDILFFAGVGVEVFISIAAGITIGAGVAYYIKKIKVNIPTLLIVLAFVIYNVSQVISELISENMGINFHLEPLLIAISCGFYIQNFTKGGPQFIDSIERSSLPIYVLFFAMAGMAVDINIFKGLIHIAFAFVLLRGFLAFISGYTAGKISKAPLLHSKLYGLGFVTQAGVSIGLTQEIMRRFPDFGISLGVLLISVININQIIGPITFKLALGKVGEIVIKKIGRKANLTE